MIETLKRDLAESDSRFLDEQAAQSEDVRILQERIENQVKFIRKQYKNHIQFIKVSILCQLECKKLIKFVSSQLWTNRDKTESIKPAKTGKIFITKR